MYFRPAQLSDIDQIFEVRFSVKENQLLDPSMVTKEDCVDYLNRKGKGWICLMENQIVGFGIVDLLDHNIWALFVRPEFAGKGIGKELLRLMVEWYFQRSTISLWLSTDEGTRAEIFYQKQGWRKVGHYKNTEIKLELTYHDWSHLK
jgi:GNAT superfamily N-acetyltransferase